MNTDVLRLASAYLCLATGLSACGPQGKFQEPSESCENLARATSFIVKWKSGAITVEEAADQDEFLNGFMVENDDLIERAEHDYTIKLTTRTQAAGFFGPSDLNWGQKKVDASFAWQQGLQGEGVIVAVIDSGVDVHHSELRSRLAVNRGEIPGNGQDDDGNGLVDDYYGYNFETDQPMSSDPVGHGSHVAGIIAADHGVGRTKGVAPKAQILPVGIMGADGGGSMSSAITAIDYAVSRGAQIINASWAGESCSQLLLNKIDDLESSGVLFVAAAGNSGKDLEIFPEFPAAFPLANQITVGASNDRGQLASFSNFSHSLVHLVAPGESIFSTVSTGQSIQSGTSMAAPFVAGAAAVLWGAHPQASAAQIKQALLESTTVGPFEVQTRGELNIDGALARLAQLME